MKISVAIEKFSVVVTGDDDAALLSISADNYRFDGDIGGLVDAGMALAEAVQAKLDARGA